MSEDKTHARDGDDQHEGGDDVETDATASSNRDEMLVALGQRLDGLLSDVVRGWFHGKLLGKFFVS